MKIKTIIMCILFYGIVGTALLTSGVWMICIIPAKNVLVWECIIIIIVLALLSYGRIIYLFFEDLPIALWLLEPFESAGKK